MDFDNTRLISEVERYPELYDNTHPNFKNKDWKMDIWVDITYKLRKQCDEESVRQVRMRWKSLRDSYVKATKYRTALSKAQAKPKKNWRYSQSMSFLDPFLGSPNPAKGVRNKKRKLCDVTEVEPVENFFVTPEDLQEVSENGCNDHLLGDWSEYPPAHQFSSPPRVNQENDIDSFFKGIADTVKKLNSVNQVKIQRDIVNMVLDIKLKEIQDNKDPLDVL
ncbi:hypothetical protein NQ314_003562 [Rhamnusium bicolor]|uniref:MADF domain-containing protein n=1 Tax=Rhamnusium bicolor TaxID=1586634 RepID=A0AAV8ZLQ1_9CUCU|nr:hypothetical protein NQ314_003562 [Rhamnusium bicolor]